jgi:hypothetical protein
MRLNYIWWFGNYGRLQSTWKLSFLFCLSNSWIFQFKIEHVIREWFVKLGFATSSIILSLMKFLTKDTQRRFCNFIRFKRTIIRLPYKFGTKILPPVSNISKILLFRFIPLLMCLVHILGQIH